MAFNKKRGKVCNYCNESANDGKSFHSNVSNQTYNVCLKCWYKWTALLAYILAILEEEEEEEKNGTAN